MREISEVGSRKSETEVRDRRSAVSLTSDFGHLTSLLTSLLIFFILCASAFAFAGSLTLVPNASDPNLAGHRLYVTTTDGELFGGVDIGSATKVCFNLEAYNGAGIGNAQHSGSTTVDLAATPTPSPPPPPLAAFVNISARAKVDSRNYLFVSFIVSNQAGKVLVRALGPSIGVSGALADPVLEIKTSAGAVVAQNDDWKRPTANQAAISATGFAPTNDKESALVLTLQPGAYIAIVHGKGKAAGVVLAQVILIQ